jgi:hypothetical protein
MQSRASERVNEKIVEKLAKGATVTIAGVLSYEEYEK